MSKQKYYVALMRRWGKVDTRSYVLGVWNKKHAAIKAGNDECAYRGGKYEPEVLEFDINSPGSIKYIVACKGVK